MSVSLSTTIGGSSVAVKRGTFRLSRVANGRTTGSIEVVSTDGMVRPATLAVAVISGDESFSGLVSETEEIGIASGATAGIITRCTLVDYNGLPERRAIKTTLAAGTLKSMLTTLVSSYFSALGISLDAGQVDGPTLPDVPFENYENGAAVLNALSDLTAKYGSPYIWTISDSKVLSMFQPSSSAAPFNLTDGDGHVVGDMTVDVTRDQYANRIIVKVPPVTEDLHEETFTGDGTTTVFTLQYTPTKMYGYVDVDGDHQTLNTPDDPDPATWTFDAATNTITRNTGAPASGAIINLHFDGTFTATGIAEDAGEIASVGIWERVIQIDSVPTTTTAQAIADAELARALAVPKTVKYRTLSSGMKPGQTQHVTSTLRDLDVDAIVTEVTTTDLYEGDRLVYDVTLTTGTKPQDNWRDVYVQWSSDTGGGGASASTPAPTGGASIGPSPPERAVQFYNGGAFGGDDAFLYYKDENSVVCGGGGSSITAADFESCQVFGYDCHIADPA